MSVLNDFILDKMVATNLRPQLWQETVIQCLTTVSQSRQNQNKCKEDRKNLVSDGLEKTKFVTGHDKCSGEGFHKNKINSIVFLIKSNAIETFFPRH